MVSEIAFAEAEKCAKESTIPVAVRDYRAQLENRGIEAILICSSSDTHAAGEPAKASKRKSFRYRGQPQIPSAGHESSLQRVRNRVW